MNCLTKDQLDHLLQVQKFPCVSLYMPVQKEGADTRQGSILLRKTIKTIDEKLHGMSVRTPVIEHLIKPVEALYDDALFWEYQDLGLGLLFNDDGLNIWHLPFPCLESVTLSDRYMILPLLATIGMDRSYSMLSLGLADTHLYRCTRHTLTEVTVPNMPASLKSVIETYSTEKQLQHNSGVSGGGSAVFHSAESAKDSEKDRIGEYFRQIESSLKKVLPHDDSPLVVTCVDYLFPIFRSIFKDPRLMNEHISGAPDSYKRDALLRQGWQIIQGVYHEAKTNALKTYRKLQGSDRVEEDIRKILPAAQAGRLDILFLQQWQRIWGQYNPLDGHVKRIDPEPELYGAPDLLNQAALLTLDHGGQVFSLDRQEMPSPTACIGVMRF
ncbi:MAG: hypothetical protein VB070_14690 [Clostridiaceae bacterium]|nr:hypothetical protein [Clostridiaceae bacterium]